MGTDIFAIIVKAYFRSTIVIKFLSKHYIIQFYDERSTLWWAGKILEKNKKISDYVGQNEKTKIIVKAQKVGGEQPLR